MRGIIGSAIRSCRSSSRSTPTSVRRQPPASRKPCMRRGPPLMPVVVKGIAEVVQALDQLPDKLQRKGLAKALFRAGSIARRAIYAAAPVRTGTLKRSIRIWRIRQRQKGEVGYQVGTTGAGFHGRFVEL